MYERKDRPGKFRPTIKRSCKHCGNEFEARIDQLRVGRAIYCSQRCTKKETGKLSGAAHAKKYPRPKNDKVLVRHAQHAARQAIKKGVLVRGPCESCGTAKDVQSHHDDYDRPLEVKWLCITCHAAHHMKEILEQV